MSANLTAIWREEACIPRREVIEGTLTDAELALSLSAVVWGRAKPPYNNPVTFFQSTHLTGNMKIIVENVLGRLSGARKGINPIIVLDVGFGGGKTHTLVTLFYAAKYPSEAQKYLLQDLNQLTKVKVVAISGDEYGSEGVEREGERIRTIWGDLFWQLGVYQRFSKLDKDARIPSLADIRTALEGGPVVVLIDELPTYFKLLASEGFQDKAVQFIQRLVIAISEIDNACLLLAIAEDVYKIEADRARKAIYDAVNEAMADTRAQVRRKETVLVPVAEEDVVHILKRRLFEKISETHARLAAESYHQLYSRLAVPEKWKGRDYENSIQESYPFHPELIRVLYERVSTIDKFNRTRGAIRLLSRVIRRIWSERESDAILVHPFHVDLADQGILDDLTTGLGEERRRNAAEADIWSSKGGATAQELDNQSREHWGAPLVRRACNTIFLYSLAAGREGALGINSEALTALCTTPQRPDHYMRIRDTVLTYLLDSFQFIDRRGERYVFVKEPTPSRVIEQLSRDITEDESLKIIEEKLEELYSGDPDWLWIEPFPSNPAKIPDQPHCTLAILNPSLHTLTSSEREPSDDVTKFLLYKDESGKKLRQFINSTFLLVASSDRLESLRLAARRLKAARMVQDDLLKFNIPKDRKSDVAEYQARQEKNLNDYLRTAFCNLVYFESHGPAVKTISSNGYGSAKNGKQVIIHQLVNVINRIKEESLDPSYVFEYAWPKGAAKTTVKSLYEQFSSVPGLIIPATKEIFQKTIKRGLDEGSWVLKVGDSIFTHEKMPSVISIDDRSELYTFAEAESSGLLKQPESKFLQTKERFAEPGERQELINTLALGDARLEALSEDLVKRARRDKFDNISSITLRMSDAELTNLINIKNLFTRLSPEKDVVARLEATIQRPRQPKFTLTLDISKEDLSQEEGKSLFDVAWRLKGAEDCEMTLSLEWKSGSSPEQVSELIRSITKGSDQPMVGSLEARVGRRGIGD
jgi:hypothetical protein